MTRRILIVEDEPAIAENIVYALETEGFETAVCATGGEARDALAENVVSLIVLDVGLPDCNGFDLCREIRRSRTTPVVFLTARSDEIDRVVGLEIGADDYVVKPFSPRELAARVKAILRRSRTVAPAPSTPVDCGLFMIDANRMRIAFRGRALELTPFEYKILETLLERPGWVFTRRQLMDRATSEPTPSLERTVDTHIKSLRSKLREIDPEADPIVTHRGAGYSLSEKT